MILFRILVWALPFAVLGAIIMIRTGGFEVMASTMARISKGRRFLLLALMGSANHIDFNTFILEMLAI